MNFTEFLEKVFGEKPEEKREDPAIVVIVINVEAL